VGPHPSGPAAGWPPMEEIRVCTVGEAAFDVRDLVVLGGPRPESALYGTLVDILTGMLLGR